MPQSRSIQNHLRFRRSGFVGAARGPDLSQQRGPLDPIWRKSSAALRFAFMPSATRRPWPPPHRDKRHSLRRRCGDALAIAREIQVRMPQTLARFAIVAFERVASAPVPAVLKPPPRISGGRKRCR